jgi:hypothetical protein
MMVEDSRRLKRRKPDTSIQVVDCMTLQPIGFIADLSEVGMMVTSVRGVKSDGLYQCEIRFQPSSGIDKCILVGVHELWSANNARTGEDEAGFRFIDINPDDRLWLRAWVNEPGSSYG